MGNDEVAKLKTMLGYWMEHNREHSEEFREWASKTKGFGKGEVGEDMLRAAGEMDKASQILSRALSLLGEREV